MRSLLFLLAVLSAPCAAAQDISDLRWLSGCWRTEAPSDPESGATYTEVWIAPPAPMLLGFGFTVGEGEVQGWEQTRIEVNGRLEFVAMPLGGFPVRFQIVEAAERPENARHADNYVVFENPAHDFPQRISYMRDGNRLTAEISSIDRSDAYTFEYRRIRCPANLRP